MSKDLPVAEELDFAYLLELMRPMHMEPEFAWLPELFCIVGHEKLIDLCKYAGGEYIRIPTLSQLADSIDALQWFYDVRISHKHKLSDIPDSLLPLFYKIDEVYDVRNN